MYFISEECLESVVYCAQTSESLLGSFQPVLATGISFSAVF